LASRSNLDEPLQEYSGWQWTVAALLLVALTVVGPFVLLFNKDFTTNALLLARFFPIVPFLLMLSWNIQKFFGNITNPRFSFNLLWMTGTLGIAFAFSNPFVTYARANSVLSKMIFFCTDRAIHDGRIVDVYSDCEEGDQLCSPLTYGIVEVLIPWEPNSAAPEGARLRIAPDISEPRINRWDRLQPEQFYREVSRAVAESPVRDAFLFVHGFRNNFNDATLTTARLSVNLKLRGATILFSWAAAHEGPLSAGVNYGADSLNARMGANDLSKVLPNLVKSSSADRFEVLAHSAGTFVVTQAIYEETGRTPPNEHLKIRDLILAAPDISPQFLGQVAEALRSSSKTITLYFSSGDLALWASTAIQGGTRVGRSASRVRGIDFINAEGLDPSWIGHFYLYQGKVLNDIFALVHTGAPAEERIDVIPDPSTNVYHFVNRESDRRSFLSRLFGD
jgi:hypothetical protein